MLTPVSSIMSGKQKPSYAEKLRVLNKHFILLTFHDLHSEGGHDQVRASWVLFPYCTAWRLDVADKRLDKSSSLVGKMRELKIK